MDISRSDLEQAVSRGLLTRHQADELWADLQRRVTARASAPVVEDPRSPRLPAPRFDFVHVAYYFGALIVIGAMGWFMNVGWEKFGGGGILAISCAYAISFVAAGRTLWSKDDLRTPGGLLITMAVAMTPLGIYGLQRWMGWWPQTDPGVYRDFHVWIRGGWFAMEVGTIAAGVVALRFFRFPFLTSTIAFTLWYMSMDVAPLLYDGEASWNQRAWVSVCFGAAVLLVGYVADRRTREDYSFWLYLFGLLAFWGGLSSMESSTELRRFLYLLVNLGLIAIAVLFNRRAFIVFGSLGVIGYISHLAHRVFKDSLLFPFALSLVGIGIIAAGVTYHRNRARYERALLSVVPDRVRSLLPPARLNT